MISVIKSCLNAEAKALLNLSESLTNNINNIVPFLDILSQCKGKRCFIGVGKSQIVASKIASSFASVGYAAIGLDPVQLLHGDLGFFSQEDIIIAISNSGETNELIMAVKNAKNLGVTVISITGNTDSTLAQLSSCHILVKVEEAGPFGLVPSSSTTAVMALGDALLCGLVKRDNLTVNDFLRYHPGGVIGKIK